ncbi:FaeA/PapI family transcriptional regulator [Candidatus Woesearchaeota archaeon]|nr:FaeA/PapI family transcriptional regulator [Candidatus Woesearchaeota archaeon]
MEDTKDKILQFIREKGPVLPADIAQHISSNILMASAHLSELSSNKKVRISHVKVGGSPLYFLPGQESQLQNFAGNLHEKEKKAYDLLSQKKILKDNSLEPVIRVALRAIKDYAVPLQVNLDGSSDIFWKWYLLANEEAEQLIRQAIKGVQKPEEKEIKKPEESTVQKKENEPEKKESEKPAESIVQKTEKPLETEIQKKPAEPYKKEKAKKINTKKTSSNQFMEKVLSYFNRNKITLLSKEPIRISEIDFIVQIPSALGDLEYYCKAKDKKRVNDSDLASAFAQGQLRKLPVLLITPGDLTKRAKEMLQRDFKGMGVKRI